MAILAGYSPMTGEFPAQRPVTRSFDVFLDLRLIKRLSEQSRGWWFETQSHPLWCNENILYNSCIWTTCIDTMYNKRHIDFLGDIMQAASMCKLHSVCHFMVRYKRISSYRYYDPYCRNMPVHCIHTFILVCNGFIIIFWILWFPEKLIYAGTVQFVTCDADNICHNP